MQEEIGFQVQSVSSGACGKYALIHSLLLLGIPITRKDANKATRRHDVLTRKYGTDEKSIMSACQYFDCKPFVITELNTKKFRSKIDKCLSRGLPVIICAEAMSHWAVLAGRKNKDLYYWIDSADDKVIGFYEWDSIVDWIRLGCRRCKGSGMRKCITCSGDGWYRCENCNGEGWGCCQGRGIINCPECKGTGKLVCEECKPYAIAIEPRHKHKLRKSLVKKFTSVYKLLKDNDILRSGWGWYVEDLFEIFDCPKDTSSKISSQEFFKKYGKLILNSIDYYYIYAELKEMQTELENYSIVADVYNLSLSRDKIPDAIAKFAAALTVIACWD